MKAILTLAVMSAFAFAAFAEPAKTDKPAMQCCGGACKTSCCKAAAKTDKKCCGEKCTCACCAK